MWWWQVPFCYDMYIKVYQSLCMKTSTVSWSPLNQRTGDSPGSLCAGKNERPQSTLAMLQTGVVVAVKKRQSPATYLTRHLGPRQNTLLFTM